MWIMLTKRLPIERRLSPPKLSIHWAKPWPMERSKSDQRELSNLLRKGKRGTVKTPEEVFSISKEFWEKKDSEGPKMFAAGLSPNPYTAVAIIYKDEQIRVWDYEFNTLSNEAMQNLVGAEESAYDLVLAPAADSLVKATSLDVEQKQVRDAAMVDGCTPNQATQVSLGLDIFNEVEFPPIGWYRCRREYALTFCHEEEIDEE